MKFFEPGTSNAVPVSIFSIHPPKGIYRVPYGVKCDVGTNNTNNSFLSFLRAAVKFLQPERTDPLSPPSLFSWKWLVLHLRFG